ncbi:aspartyl/glutamyl-tRNA(Asn/Gln) amidotransferase subunit B [Nitrosomonas cryotolerans]|uniref:Aspartyl/glutamyl-tRNA(Asn/Gln) amidotransferase subunit B n=1 Tax=Nitrosomonas cryotolerans ATCC 49181 TaxID=1131553 RepID=A0A1N6JGV3_9PROT|nr:Asp-tRNA(Asn)/Glu-tRNA(Gln) amidotransferase subunit GatB [Nitrosomonas cryotolerans]SFP67517.1 aspartyl/glutamyl-tRNA(Asn/Gln) amidotransferase subunit B [Nitrosomonas cryotolerans]SIO43453.1 aspartyl/glutamyl-tRNA(Asn/Gln) amidotransferase subunit B [Nitrosomonas cryotolerans ATCC 49181]
MQWEIVIGLEVHTQLSTQSKIFSSASTAYGAIPNSQACAVDLALPGVLPVLNRGAVERAIKFALAVGAKINSPSIFARKNYFYPDLPKGYQISQFELPIVSGGHVKIQVGETERVIRLTRAHLEEDAGKSLHEDFHGMSGIDLNRAGTPLLEIVSEPDIRGSAEAVVYAKTLHALVRWIGICDGNMQEGSFRCDANVSVRPHGSDKLGTRCEIKNLNSFRFLEKAIDYEARRQIEILEEGGSIRQETRLYDSHKNETRTMRSKEDANDYRYFPDPDLLPLEISTAWIREIEATLPELPEARRNRYVTEFCLSIYDATLLTATREMADFFESTVKLLPAQAKLCANWIMGEISARQNRDGVEITACPINPTQLAALLLRISDGTISGKAAKSVFDCMWNGEEGGHADAIIEAKGLKQILGDSEIEGCVDAVLIANLQQVMDYRSGKEKAFNSLVGQVMKATKGKANPAQVSMILKKKLAE